jgi:UDP-2-acetamido-3-amino-2,3-dideoxy-glucuronate N-acetyltransferase
MVKPTYFAHESAVIDQDVSIGDGTKIWHFSKLLGPCTVGENCVLGHNVVVERRVQIGNGVRIQNNVSVYSGVTLEDDVFCGPSMVFTNVTTPRSHFPRRDALESTLVKKGASIGANATIICGTTINQYAMVGAGSVVTKDVPAYGLVLGVPAKLIGFVCYCGTRLGLQVDAESEKSTCSHCDRRYTRQEHKISPCP